MTTYDFPVLLDRLTRCRDQWATLVETMPEMVIGPNSVQIHKSTVTAWFDKVAGYLESLCESGADAALVALHMPSVDSQVQQIENLMNTAASHGAAWLQKNTGTLFNHFWSIKSSLFWVIPEYPPHHEKDVDIIFSEYRSLQHNLEELKSALSAQRNSAKELQALLVTSQDTAAQIAGHEREAGTAQTNAKASAVAAESSKLAVEAYAESLGAAEGQQKSLFDQFEGYREKVESTLKGASKVALAASFSQRRKALRLAQWVWAGAFVTGIALLLAAGCIFTGILEVGDRQSLAGTGSITLKYGDVNATAAASLPGQLTNELFARFVPRLMIIGPLIWLCWFAARQYGHTLRLIEDYAFKEASALAYIGYRSEMGDDGEMLKLLTDSAIKNFGANPTRMLEKQDPSSPVQEAIESALAKLNPDNLVDLIKSLTSKDRR